MTNMSATLTGATMSERTPEQSMDDAISALRRNYYTDIRELAEEIKQAIKDGEIEDREALYERVHDACDGSQWVIYTRNARTVLLVSDNDGAYADEYGPEGMVTDGELNWSVMAYAAMEWDLFEALARADVDVNGEDRTEMLKEEDAEEAEEE